MDTNNFWKLIDVLNEATGFLQFRQIESARRNAEALLASVLGLTRVELYLQFDRPLTRAEREQYKALLRRRAQHEPLQYILGQTEFYGLTFAVTPDVLIPRPETELLIEKAVEILSKHISFTTVLDIGTGSGNIAVALARALGHLNITAIDSNAASLEVAKSNADLNKVRDQITFQQADILNGGFSDGKQSFDLVVSNPPYIADNEMDGLMEEVRDFEPHAALEAGERGLRFYTHFARSLPSLVRPGGFVAVEIGYDQADAVRSLFAPIAKGGVNIMKDLSGLDRIVSFQISGENGKS